MIGSTLGPYRIDSELGAGGMGTVYLATVDGHVQGVERGTRVAVKVVHPHLLSTPGFFKRFLREADLGKAVRHENVVRTIDVDATEIGGKSAHYLVMEYVEGRTLRALLQDLGTVPESLLREVAVQIAAGLEAIHAQGIVHRDLKPDNVLLTLDQRVRIMDLGVARLQEATVAITREGQFAGSLLYAAPEQFRSEPVGPPADLYSVGVTLYELATGRNPFEAGDVGSVIAAHLNLVPPSASARNTDLSLFVGEIVATLLQKKAADRIGSASELKKLLAEGERSAWWTAREGALRRAQKQLPRIPVRRDTEFYGREAELQLLAKSWADAKAGHGTVVLIEGESGIGKTRLVDAFLRTTEADDAHILYGSYPPSGGIGGMSDALVEKFGAAGLAAGLKPYLTVTPTLVPAFAAMLKHESPPTGADPVQGDALHAVFCHLMKALAAEKPLIWIVDDLHFAPADSRRVALALARALEEHRVLLVLTARPGVIPDDETAHFSRLARFRRATLPRLSPREVIQLLRDALHSETLAERLGGKIAYKSDGVPFFVFEIVRGMKEGRVLVEQADGSFVATQVIDDVKVPSAVKDLVAGRLSELKTDERAILEVGAVEGFQFDPDLARRVLEMPKLTVLRTLAEIERRTGIVRSGAGFVRFDHHQLQEVLYESLTHDLCAEYHAMLADVFAEREAVAARKAEAVPGPTAYFLAWHGLRGSRPAGWTPYLVPALEHLEKTFRNDTLLALADAALAAERLVEGAARVDVLLRKATCLDRLGLRRPQLAALEDAQQSAVALGDKAIEARALGAMSTYSASAGSFEAALEHAQAAQRIACELPDTVAELRARYRVAQWQFWLARPDAGRASIDALLTLARRIGDRAAEAEALFLLGTNAAFFSGELDRGDALYEESVEISRALGDTTVDASTANNRAWLKLLRGRLGDAAALLDLGLSAEREHGHRAGECVTLVNIGFVRALLGDARESTRLLTDCRALCREIADRRVESYAIHRLGLLAEQEGGGSHAEELFRSALVIRREIRYPLGVAESALALGVLLLSQGRRADASACFSEAEAVARDLGNVGLSTLIAVHRARSAPADASAAAALVAENDARLDHFQKMEARHVLWTLTKDRAHLAEAKRLLDHLVAHAPAEFQGTMVGRVPLYRDIAAAAKGAGL